MPAPVQKLGSPFQSAWNNTTTPKTASIGSVSTGDLIVVLAMDEDTSDAINTPTNADVLDPAPITWTARGTVTTASRCEAAAWTGIVTGGGDLIVSVSATGSGQYGFAVWAFAAIAHGGVGLTPAGATAAGSAPTLTAAWSANSLICCCNGDWTAGAHGPPRDYRTGAGSATEVNYTQASGYSVEAWHHADTGAGGSQAVGLATPNMTWSLIAVEVLGTGDGGPPPAIIQPYNRKKIKFSRRGYR